MMRLSEKNRRAVLGAFLTWVADHTVVLADRLDLLCCLGTLAIKPSSFVRLRNLTEFFVDLCRLLFSFRLRLAHSFAQSELELANKVSEVNRSLPDSHELTIG